MPNMWQVYILKCADGTFYTGMTTDLERRIHEHNDSKLGAKYTRGRRPVEIVYARNFKNKSLVSKEEVRIKKMNRKEKKELIARGHQAS